MATVTSGRIEVALQYKSRLFGIIALFLIMVVVWNIRQAIWYSHAYKPVMTVVDVIIATILLFCFLITLGLASELDKLTKRGHL
jgi:hypothetical protein